MINAPANSSGGLLGSITGFFSPKKNNPVPATPSPAPAAVGGRRKKHRKTRKHRKHAKKSRKNRK